MSESILVIGDERNTLDFLRRGLAYEGYQVQVTPQRELMLQASLHQMPSLVILDGTQPGLDRFEVVRRLRVAPHVPVLMLTGKASAQVLDSGADDFLVKPFGFEEFLTRVRTLLRRHEIAEPSTRVFADVVLDTKTRQVTRAGRRIDLTTRQFDLLHLFMLHPRQVLPHPLIYERVWGFDVNVKSNSLEACIRYLRAKLEANGEPRLIQTVRGTGYVLQSESIIQNREQCKRIRRNYG